MTIAHFVWLLFGLFCGIVWTLAIGAVLGYSHAGTITVLLIGVVLGLIAAWIISRMMSRI
jgi:uncharacterized membrane protein (UPF0136 family)